MKTNRKLSFYTTLSKSAKKLTSDAIEAVRTLRTNGVKAPSLKSLLYSNLQIFGHDSSTNTEQIVKTLAKLIARHNLIAYDTRRIFPYCSGSDDNYQQLQIEKVVKRLTYKSHKCLEVSWRLLIGKKKVHRFTTYEFSCIVDGRYPIQVAEFLENERVKKQDKRNGTGDNSDRSKLFRSVMKREADAEITITRAAPAAGRKKVRENELNVMTAAHRSVN